MDRKWCKGCQRGQEPNSKGFCPECNTYLDAEPENKTVYKRVGTHWDGNVTEGGLENTNLGGGYTDAEPKIEKPVKKVIKRKPKKANKVKKVLGDSLNPGDAGL